MLTPCFSLNLLKRTMLDLLLQMLIIFQLGCVPYWFLVSHVYMSEVHIYYLYIQKWGQSCHGCVFHKRPQHSKMFYEIIRLRNFGTGHNSLPTRQWLQRRIVDQCIWHPQSGVITIKTFYLFFIYLMLYSTSAEGL